MKEAAMQWPERSTGGGTSDAPSQGNTGLRRTASFDDAHATAKIFVELLAELKTIGVNNFGEARRLSRKKRYAEPTAAAA